VAHGDIIREEDLDKEAERVMSESDEDE